MKAVVMAGGRGTRIAAVHSEIPKPMIPLLGKPVLERQIDALREQGFTDVVLVIGYLGHVIRRYFGDGSGISPADGKPFGVHIAYVEETEPLGTAGALYLLREELSQGDFLLLNGDILFDVDISRFYRAHKAHGGLATLFTHPNSHPYDSGILVTDETGRVQNWLHREDKRLWVQNRVNAGLHFLSGRIFSPEFGLFRELKKMDLDREVLKPLIPSGGLYAYDSPEYVMDMGTPDRLEAASEDLRAGRVRAKNLRFKQRAVFLDRDGTVNRYAGFLRRPEEFELLPGVGQAVRRLNQAGILAVVATNQPVIARGEVTPAGLREIHNKMETLLGREGAYLDGIYVCPHHPDGGYPGERPEYKIDCACRKPKPGLLLRAAEDLQIDLGASWMVGDTESDMEAGRAAGCRTAFLGERDAQGRPGYPDLAAAVDDILKISGK
ncbi:MAG TPA: HAD-IIIA family hydrolase [Firmicutes bacterium]|nr:HAD-IIIA family hydrolase [Bacillota bacterium]